MKSGVECVRVMMTKPEIRTESKTGLSIKKIRI